MSLKIKKFGKFKLLKQVARGGMAEIFLASSGSVESVHKFVVIKRVLLAHSHNKEFKKMFHTEGKVAVNLNHSNICSIHEFGVVGDQYFICMEYISGRNIRQLVKKLKTQKKALDVALCAYIIKHACNGLDYAHNCTDSVTGQPFNIIHRDISPQNIMVSFDGDVKIIDFGIAKIDDSEATKVGVLKGKFEYMSPEQARGKALDRQTDIFSLGNVLWEMLAGRKLFTGANEIQLLKKIRDCQIPDIRKINPDVPQRLLEITNKSLNVNKNLRYKTAGEMGSDLAVFLNKTYPDFTHNHFSKFIKEIYVEEMLEERNNRKMYSQLLISEKLGPTGGIMSQPLRDQTIAQSRSTFIGYKDKLEEYDEEKSVEKKYDDSQITIQKNNLSTPHNHTVTETDTEGQTSTSQAQDITRTEFADELEHNTVPTVYTKYEQPDHSSHTGTKQKISVTSIDGYRNTISTSGLNGDSNNNNEHSKISSHTYDPYLKIKGANLSSVSKVSTFRKKNKKRRAVRRLVTRLLILGTIGGSIYAFRLDIKPYVSDILQKLDQFIPKDLLFLRSTSDLSAKEALSVSDPENSASVNQEGVRSKSNVGTLNNKSNFPSKNLALKPKPGDREPTAINNNSEDGLERTVFISTQPSGAHIFINNKNMKSLTPASIVVPVNNIVRLTLKRKGYKDIKVVLSPDSINRGTAHFSLLKSNNRKRRNKTIIIQ